MALAIDASSPTSVTGNAGAGTLTTANFNPPAGSLIVVMTCADDDSTPCTAAISDNQSHTYTRHARSNSNGTAEVWSYYTSTTLTGLTVSATYTRAWNSSNTGLLTVLVFTGSQSALGTIDIGNATSDSFTPQAIGSYIIGAFTSADKSATPTAYDSNTTILQPVNGGSGKFTLATFQSSTVTSSLSSAAYGVATISGSTQKDLAVVEILAAPADVLIPAPFIAA